MRACQDGIKTVQTNLLQSYIKVTAIAMKLDQAFDRVGDIVMQLTQALTQVGSEEKARDQLYLHSWCVYLSDRAT